MAYSKEELIKEIHHLADGDQPPSLSDLQQRGKYSESPFYNHFGSWNEALEEAGYEPNRHIDHTPPNKIPREALIEEIHHLADGNNPPTVSEMEELGEYGKTTYRERFGSWSEAVKEAGYTPEGTYSEEELLNEIHRLAEDGNPPSANTDLKERGKIAQQTFINHFGSWNEAVRAAGYEPHNPHTRDELLEEIHRLADGNTPPTSAQMKAEGKYSTGTYHRRFGSWNNAIREAGYEPIERQNIPENELISEIQRLGDTKRPPTLLEMARGKFGQTTYLNKFGSWRAAVRKAGYEDTVTRLEWSDESLLNEIHRLAEGDSPPTQHKMTQEGELSVAKYQARWGTWNKAVKKAGYEPNAEQNISKERLIGALQQLAEDLGHPPRANEVREQGKHPVATYEQKFGSWWAAQMEAGFRPRRMYPLTPEAFQKLYETTISHRSRQPDHTLITLLFQFTGISATGVATLSSDMVYDLKGDVGIRIPAKQTDTNTPWEFLIPESWYDPIQGEERPTHLPDLLLWYFDEYDELFGVTKRTTTHGVLYDIALDAGLLQHREPTEYHDKAVPKVTPVDLRFTHGIHIRANGAPDEYIHQRLGLSRHGTYITTDKIDFWIDRNKHLYESKAVSESGDDSRV
jgi:hypothetical protein